MSSELLVLGLCIGRYACNDAWKAYYSQNPAIKESVREVKKKTRRYVGEYIYLAAAPLYLAASGRDYQIRIYKNISCGKDNDDVMCFYNWTF